MADTLVLGASACNERMGSSPISDTIADDTSLVQNGGWWVSIVRDG